jgi:eukaryotic-like serine/threonine-protein kinase
MLAHAAPKFWASVYKGQNVRDPVAFGKYVLLERISVGGMAEVFKAKSFGVEGFEKILAIKRILPSLAEDGDFIDMFIDEAKICGQLNHANVCQIFELGRVEDSHFIAMEYVWGKDLLQMQNRFRKLRQTMKPEMAAYIASKMCEGLDYAHKKKDATGKPLGIIHRDISPQNILCSYEGELKIIDFGIAKAAVRSSKTQAGVLKGKFGYMSPEQVRGLPLDRRSDVFAIGTILYELLVADRLFVGESDFETLERVRNVDVPPPTKAAPQCPPELEKIILKALAKDVEDRYQWAGEMQEQLQAFLMSREPVFTAKNLSQWMREQFALEHKREQEVLEEQRRVGREVLQQSGPSTPARPPGPTGLVAPIAQPVTPRSAASSVPKLPPPPVTGSIGSEPRPMPMPARPVASAPRGQTLETAAAELSDADLTEAQSDGDDELEGEKTTVSLPGFAPDPAAGGAGAELPAQSTMILSSSSAAAELPAQSTVILDGSRQTQLPQVPKIGSQMSTMLQETPAAVLAVLANQQQPSVMVQPMSPPVAQPLPLGGQPYLPLQSSGTGQVSMPVGQVVPAPPMPSRGGLWKDVLIGVGVAVAVVAGVLGGRAFFMRGPGKGTLVVMSNAAHAAEVLIDGQSRGQLAPGAPLTFKELPAGSHAVVVRSTEGGEFKQTVALAAGDVSVITASIAPPPSVGAGHLSLRIPEPTADAQVWLDGAQLSEWKRPIPLRADVAHEIRVTRPASKEAHLSVTLKAGEEATRDVVLEAALGKINIVSEPAGAEVTVNGHKAGLTPVNVPEVDASKPARLTVRHKGFAPVTKYVNFDKGLEQTFEIKLMASADDGFGTQVAESGDGEKRPAKAAAAAPASAPKPLLTMDEEEEKPHPLKEKSGGEVKSLQPASGNDPGFLVANTQPWAKVIIDGKDTGKTTPIAPRSKIALKPGKHVVTFVANGKKFNFDVNIKANEDTRLIKQLTDSGN